MLIRDNKMKDSLLAKSYDVIVMQMMVNCIHTEYCPALDHCALVSQDWFN